MQPIQLGHHNIDNHAEDHPPSRKQLPLQY
jgi:hypothetical protein